jgi:hypothetical protein
LLFVGLDDAGVISGGSEGPCETFRSYQSGHALEVISQDRHTDLCLSFMASTQKQARDGLIPFLQRIIKLLPEQLENRT